MPRKPHLPTTLPTTLRANTAVLAVACVLVLPAAAQERAPLNVNDCTFLRQPIALRDCIDWYQGHQRIAPGPRLRPDVPVVPLRSPLIAAAGPIPGVRKGGRVRLGRRPPQGRPNPVAVQQVGPNQ